MKITNYILNPTIENLNKLGDISKLSSEEIERVCKVNGNFLTKGICFFYADRGLEGIYYLERHLEKNNDIEAITQLLIFSLKIKYYKKFNEYMVVLSKYASNKDMLIIKLLVAMSM